MMTIAPIDALKDAADILETEANELASYLAKSDWRTASGSESKFKDLNYRVGIAVHTEMKRLRKIAAALRKNLPKEQDEE
jgi:hypothetical protein